MFSLCQTVRISHQHHHHFQELVIPSRRSKEQHRIRSPQLQTKIAQPNTSIPLFRVQGPKVYHSNGTYHQRNRKGIEVVSKQNSKNESISAISESSMRNKLHIANNSCKRQKKPPSFFNQPPAHPQMTDREHYKKEKGEQTDLFANHYNKCDKSKSAKIDPLFTIQRSPPSFEIGKQSNQTSLTHFSRHYVRPFAYRFSSKTGESSNLTFSNQIRDFQPSTKTEEKLKEEEARQGFWSSHERLKSARPEMFGSNNISITINSAKIQSNKNSEQKLTHTQNMSKLSAQKKQLFDAVSIMSRESSEIDENLNIEESILINRQMDNFIEITQRRQLKDCRLVLALESQLHCLVSLKMYEDNEDQTHHRESLLRQRGQVDHKEFSPFLQLYQILIEGVGLTKKIIFVQQPFERMLDEQISREQLKSDRSAQQQLQNSMLQCVKEVYHILDHKSIYLAEEMNLDDFILVNGRIKIHSLTKFKPSEQLQPRELISQHRTIKHLKKQFSLKMGL